MKAQHKRRAFFRFQVYFAPIFASSAASTRPAGALIQVESQKPEKPMRGTQQHTGAEVQADLPKVRGQIQPHLLRPAQPGFAQVFLGGKDVGQALIGQHGGAVGGGRSVGGESRSKGPLSPMQRAATSSE